MRMGILNSGSSFDFSIMGLDAIAGGVNVVGVGDDADGCDDT